MNIVNGFFRFLNDQMLKMTWLWEGVRFVVEKGFGLSIDDRLGGVVFTFLFMIRLKFLFFCLY